VVTKDYQEVKVLQERTATERPSGGIRKLQNIAQVLASYGLGRATEAIGEAVSDARFRPEYDQAQAKLDTDKRQTTTLKPQSDSDKDQADIFRLHQGRPSEIDYVNQDVKKVDWVEKRATAFNKFGLNFLNRWAVNFQGNKQLDDFDQLLLHQLCVEMNVEGMEIAVDTNDIGYSREVDVSDMKFQNFTCNFIVDRDLKVKKIFERVLNKIRNFRTGRYGYRDDHKWKNVELMILNNYNMVSRTYNFKDVVISGIDALAVTTGGSETQTFQVSFEYSDISMS